MISGKLAVMEKVSIINKKGPKIELCGSPEFMEAK